jgi:hypothetical protein
MLAPPPTLPLTVVVAAVTLLSVQTCAMAQQTGTSPNQPTAQAYVTANGGNLIPAGRTEIDGRLMTCGAAATVLDPQYHDFGGSYPGFIVLNPALFAGLATPVKLWIFSHECAHQTVGADEVRADCTAVERGKREGWLAPSGLAQVCAFMNPAHADSRHFSGPQRCELMQRCYAFQRIRSTH